MLSLTQIVFMLQDRSLKIVSEKTGLHVNTIASIREGKKTPKFKTMEILSNYLTQQMKGDFE